MSRRMEHVSTKTPVLGTLAESRPSAEMSPPTGPNPPPVSHLLDTMNGRFNRSMQHLLF